MSDRLDLELRADLGELTRLADAVDAFATRNGLPPDIAFKITLCLDELITNTLSHGGVCGVISVRLRYDGTSVEVEIEDDAPPFDPFAAPPAPDLTSGVEDRPVGGLGLFLVMQTMDRTGYQRDGSRNRVRLTKHLPPPA
ncbi:ATP-binding protein [Azospirillum griseum]|nr:ATP-binding protein [Azospirillum griseum]